MTVIAIIPCALASCGDSDSRVVDKPFEELSWIERTRSPTALAMSLRHYRFTRYYRSAYDKAVKEYDSARDDFEAGREKDMSRLFRVKGALEQYRRDLISNLWECLYFKPDYRRAIYELIDVLEQTLYDDLEYGDPERELLDLAELEKALRYGSDFFGRDYEVNYKLGAVLYRQGNIVKQMEKRGVEVESVDPAEKFRDAQVFLRKCIAVRSMYAEAYQLLALCLEEENKEEEAYKFWKLIGVIEQAHKRGVPGENMKERENLFETARKRVEMYEAKFGPI